MDRNKYYGGESASMTPLEDVNDRSSSIHWLSGVLILIAALHQVQSTCTASWYGPWPWLECRLNSEIPHGQWLGIDYCSPRWILFVSLFKGLLVKLLIHTGVTRYLEFKCIEGSYVYKGQKVHKVPADEREALASCKNLAMRIQRKICWLLSSSFDGSVRKASFS